MFNCLSKEKTLHLKAFENAISTNMIMLDVQVIYNFFNLEEWFLLILL